MLTNISQLDTDLFLYLNNLGTPMWDWLWVSITEKKNHIPLMLLLLFLTYNLLGPKRFLIAVVSVALMATFTDQVTNLAKHSFLRPRPCKEAILIDQIRFLVDYCSRYGYFSGHSSNSMALALFFGLLLKPKYTKAIYFLLIWAFCMGYSRIYVGVHYPGDVISGFIFGLLSGYLFYKIYLIASKKLTTTS